MYKRLLSVVWVLAVIISLSSCRTLTQRRIKSIETAKLNYDEFNSVLNYNQLGGYGSVEYDGVLYGRDVPLWQESTRTYGRLAEKIDDSTKLAYTAVAGASVIAVANGYICGYSEKAKAFFVRKIGTNGDEGLYKFASLPKPSTFEDRISSMSIQDGWVYFLREKIDADMDSYLGNFICKIRLDGSGYQEFAPQEYISGLMVEKGWMYWLGYADENNYISRMRTDGTELFCQKQTLTALAL
jgi:hypothetical protein